MDFFCHPLFLYLRRPLVDFAFLWERRYPLQGHNVPLGTPLSPFGTPRSFWNAVLSTLGTQRSEATPELSGP